MEKRRKGSGYAWLWTVVAALWVAFGLWAIKENIDNIDIGLIPMWAVVACLPAIALFDLVKKEQFIRTVRFKIHEYERWKHNINGYKKYYIVEEVSLYAKFVYHWHKGESEFEMNESELEEHVKHINNGYGCSGHTNKHDAMVEIIEHIKKIIAHDKKTTGIRIQKIKTLETYTVDELKKKVNDGELKQYDKKKDEDGSDE